MKIVVTGAKGLLGHKLVDYLSNRKQNTVGIDIEEADITDKDQISNVIKQIQPDIVIHTAALTNLDYCEEHKEETFKVNSIGSKNIAIACNKSNCSLLLVSTDHVFKGDTSDPYHVDDTPDPISVYAQSKYAGEQSVQETLESCYIVRTAGLYGKNGRNFVDAIVNNAKNGNQLKVVNDEVCNRTYVPDLVDAIYNIIITHQFGIYHVVNGGFNSWYEYALEILELEGLKDKVDTIPVTAEEYGSKVDRPKFSALDKTKYEKITKCLLRSNRDALKEYLGIK